jgi:predicted PurR-regulated permease PerM
MGLFVLAVCHTLYLAREILMPVTAAVILALLLQPAIPPLRRVRVPEPIAAAIVVVALFAALTAGIYFLSDPAAKWMAEMPNVVETVQKKIKAPIKEIKEAKEAVEDIVDETGANGEADPDANVQQGGEAGVKPETAPPEPTRVSLIEVFTQSIAVLGDVAWGALIILVLLYFLLATGSELRENIILALPTVRDKKRAIAVTRDVQRGVSAYLVSVILINVGLGVAIGVAMHAIGLPNPALWGAMAALLNFIPYLGALAGSVVVTVVGLITYVTPVEALLPPAIYLAINSLEGYLITPAILSRRLTLNPIAVFLSVIFWGWIWGVAGALMAVPILASFKGICDATDRLAPVSQFLGGRRRP